jgi:hypothetical protein
MSALPQGVEKKWLEIGTSTGLVLLMIALMLVVQLTVPFEARSAGFAMVMLLFIVAMGFAGVKLMDMQ